MDMEPLGKITGGQDMLGIQNDHHFGPEVKYLMMQPICLKSFLTNSLSKASQKNLHTMVLRKVTLMIEQWGFICARI